MDTVINLLQTVEELEKEIFNASEKAKKISESLKNNRIFNKNTELEGLGKEIDQKIKKIKEINLIIDSLTNQKEIDYSIGDSLPLKSMVNGLECFDRNNGDSFCAINATISCFLCMMLTNRLQITLPEQDKDQKIYVKEIADKFRDKINNKSISMDVFEFVKFFFKNFALFNTSYENLINCFINIFTNEPKLFLIDGNFSGSIAGWMKPNIASIVNSIAIEVNNQSRNQKIGFSPGVFKCNDKNAEIQAFIVYKPGHYYAVAKIYSDWFKLDDIHGIEAITCKNGLTKLFQNAVIAFVSPR